MTNAVFDTFDSRGMLVHQVLSGGKLEGLANGQPHHQMMNGMMMGDSDLAPLNDAVGMGGMDGMFGPGGVEMENAIAASAAANLAGGGGGLRASRIGSQRGARNSSVISFGNHRMSLTGRMSEVSYGRAMSGLSALSIDWENMDDFDIDVDHSAHINPGQNMGMAAAAAAGGGPMMAGGLDLDPRPIGANGARRSSMRTHLMASGPGGDAHVSFDL